MPNPIKYSAEAETLALKKGNFYIGTGDVGKGPSDTTGYYQGQSPASGGYVIYLNRIGAPGNLTYYPAKNDGQLILFTNSLSGTSFTSATQCLNYYATQTDKVCFNIDYPVIVTSGLTLNLDSGFTPSYPTTGTTWYDVSSSVANATLVGSPVPVFSTNFESFGGSLTFTETGQYAELGSSSIFTNSSYTIETWQEIDYVDQSGRNNYRTSVSISGQGPDLTGKLIQIDWYSYFEFGNVISVVNKNQTEITSGSNAFNTNTWYQVVFTYNYSNNTGILYINGVENSSGAFTPFTGTNPTIRLAPNIAFNWEGKFAINRFYNRVLSASEVLQNYNAVITQRNLVDSDYQAILDYATTLQYTLPSVNQRVKQNKLLVDLKRAGIWDKLDTFAVFVTDGSSDFALIDWKRLTTYTAWNTPEFTANAGFRGNGSTSYIDTNFNPATNGVNYTQNDASRFMWNKIVSVASRYLDGNDVTGNNGMYSNNSVNNKINQGTANLSAAAPMNNLGLSSINRISSTQVILFDDTTQYSGTANSSSVTSSNQFIFRGGTSYSNQQTSIYGMGASLVSENTALYNALNTYITSL